MDFHQLLAKMQELDSPATATQPVQAEECGMMPPPTMPDHSQPPVPPPSLSVNLNAQGMDNIEQIMKLITKVNPDAVPQQPPMPSMAPPPSIMSIKPELPPLKMLPDFDADNDKMPGGETDIEPLSGPKGDPIAKMGVDIDDKGSQPGGLGSSLDRDGDGDHDMDDHGMEPKDDEDDEKKKEAWANEPDTSEKSIDYMNNKLAGGMNKPKDTFPKVADGDNPMQKVRESDDDLRTKIRAELRSRLAEAKNSRLDEGPMDLIKKAGSAVKGAVTGAVAGAKKAMVQPAAGSTGVSPAQAGVAPTKPAAGSAGKPPAQAQQGSNTPLTPELANVLSYAMKDIAGAIEANGYDSVEKLKQDIDNTIKKQTARTDLGAK